MYTYIIFIMHVNYVDIYIYVQTKGTGTSLASHHFRSASAGPIVIRIHPIRIHPLPLACSPWTFRSPSGYIHRSSILAHDLAASFGHRQYFSPGFSSSKVLLLRHRLHLQVSVSFTINSSFETMGEVLHIVSTFSPICGWTVHIFAEQKGPGHLSY